MILFSRKFKNTTPSAKEWRNEVAYRSMILLRTTVAVIEYPYQLFPPWNVPELSGVELQVCKPPTTTRWIHGHHHHHHHDPEHPSEHDARKVAEWEHSVRVPFQLAFLLRETICGQEERLSHPMLSIQEMKLLEIVDNMLQGYYGIQRCFLMMKGSPPAVSVSLVSSRDGLTRWNAPFLAAAVLCSTLASY